MRPTIRFVARAAVVAALAWASELVWTVRLAPRGAGWTALALLGANAALALVLMGLATVARRLAEEGWGLEARWARGRRGPLAAMFADGIVSLGLAALGAGLYVAIVRAAHDEVAALVRTAAFRGPLVALVALFAGLFFVALGPGLVAPLRRRLARARAITRVGAAAVVVLMGLAAIGGAFVRVSTTVAELDPPWIFATVVPPLALALGWLVGPLLARRGTHRLWLVVLFVLLLSAVASVGLLAQRRVLRATVASSAFGAGRAVALLAGALASGTPAPPGPATRLFPRVLPTPVHAVARHLVFVSIDALRFDRAFPPPGARARRLLMPRLAALAARGTRFDAAYCTVPGSLRALPSILTGLYSNALPWARPSSLMIDPAGTRSLSEILAAEGFDTVFVPHTRYVMNEGTTQGFARVIDPVLLPAEDRMKKRPRDLAMVAATLDELRRRRAEPAAGAKRLFLWSHFIDPHAPYWDAGHPGGEDVRYDEATSRADSALGMLLDGLDRVGVLDDAIVVVTADHGEELGEHGTIRHSRTVWDAAVRVPLVIAVPGGAARRIDVPVSHVDLLPTLLPLLGLDPPAALDGRSLASTVLGGTPPPARTIVVVTYPMSDPVPAEYAAIRGADKLVTNRQGLATGLYDYRRDPLERDNLLDSAPATVRALEADVSRYRTRGLGAAPSQK